VTAAAQAVQPPPITENPQEHFARLRAWTAEKCADPDPVRRAAVHMALSAIAHRMMKYGPDESLNACSSRELMVLLLFLNGPLAEYVMRVAYFRSIIEGEHTIYEQFNSALFIPECRAWYWTIAEAVMARAPDPEAVTVWLENMRGEEKSVARLVIARCYPDVAHIDWLADVPDQTQPQNARLAAELCHVLLTKPSYVPLVKNYLRTHPHVRYAVPEDRWPKI
jgi:hypothetical protein